MLAISVSFFWQPFSLLAFIPPGRFSLEHRDAGPNYGWCQYFVSATSLTQDIAVY
jgi:hypothetical protein